MFTVTDDEATTIRTAFEQEGELSAGVELRRLFPGITAGAKAREMARVIAGWRSVPATHGDVPPRRNTTRRVSQRCRRRLTLR